MPPMQREPPSRQRATSGSTANPLNFDTKLDREDEVLEAMIAALARGQLAPDAWDKLFAAAKRDDKMSELAFAYESISQGKRLKAAAAAVQAEFLFQASRFFSEVFGDEFGATAYAERALVALPAHQGAFEKLEALLTKAKSFKRLAAVYAEVAAHKPRAEHAGLLRRSAELLEKLPGGEE